MEAEKWANVITDWIPEGGRRSRGGPKMRWRDDLDRYCEDWRTLAIDRTEKLNLTPKMPGGATGP